MAKLKTVRVVKTRYGTYSLHFINPDGRRRRISVGPDLQLAQRQAIRFTDWLMEGKNPESEIEYIRLTERLHSITIREFFLDFMEGHGKYKSEKMQISYRNSFKNICRCPEIADSELLAVSKKKVLDYMDARMKQDNVTAATVNREAALLKIMLSCANEWDITNHNPLQNMRLFRETGKREVNITPDQAANLLQELPKPLADIVEFAIYTGFRKQNILGLKIEDVRFHDLTITGETELIVKGGRKEKFPLGELAVEVLKRVIGDRKEGYIFLNPLTKTRYYSTHKVFNKAVRKIGLTVNGTKFRFHDLRHVFATWLHQAGVSLDILRPLMGHRDRATTDRYATIDRMSIGKVLKVMPRIEQKSQKKSLIDEYSSVN